MSQEFNISGGLLETPDDPRDFPLGGIQDNKISDVPLEDFMVSDKLFIKDQGGSDFCTGYALAAVSEDQEGVELDPAFLFAMIKREMGNIAWGGDLRTGCKVAQKVGAIEVGQNPDDFGRKSRDFVANWNNWKLDLLLPLASKRLKKSYFKVGGQYDTFDNLRVALWSNKEAKRSIYTGCTWRPGWMGAKGGVIPSRVVVGGVGHAFKVCGQKIIKGVPHLVVQNSYNTDTGDGGLFYFPREVVNREFNFGAYMFIDMDPEEARGILEEKGLLVETKDHPFLAWLKRMINKFL